MRTTSPINEKEPDHRLNLKLSLSNREIQRRSDSTHQLVNLRSAYSHDGQRTMFDYIREEDNDSS